MSPGIFIPRTRNHSHELEASVGKKYAWLALYLAFNLALTMFNKVVLGNFPLPFLLTAVHAFCGMAGCFVLYKRGAFTLTKLTQQEELTLLLFSILYTINIALSNASLKLVSIPFHQVTRATTPLFTLALNILCYNSRYSILTYISLVLVTAGVGFATFGDYYFQPIGFFLTLMGAFSAALKTVVTNGILTGRLRLSPLELLFRMSPLAFVQTIIYGYLNGEMSLVYNGMQAARNHGSTDLNSNESGFVLSRVLVLKLLLNGIIAFGLNIVSFTANKNTSALTITVASNIKQVMTIVLAIVFFKLEINAMIVFGIIMTIVGGAWFAKLERNQSQATPSILPQSVKVN